MARGSNISRGILWEVLAPVIRWPLRSPARLGLVLLTVAAVLVGLSHLTGGSGRVSRAASTASGGWQPPTDSWTPGTFTATPTFTETSTSSGPAPLTPAQAQARAVRPTVPPGVVAAKFVTAWARPTLPAAKWLPGVASLSTPAFGTALKSVNPANVPGTRLVGTPRVRTTTPVGAVVEASTDRAVVTVTLVSSGTTWKVSAVTPARMILQTPGAGTRLRATYTPLPTSGR